MPTHKTTFKTACYLLILGAFALRLHYLTTTHPFFDEYITTLAARETWTHGWPRLPSGLFYEHGLLATYLIAPFTALYIHSPLETWQPAQWGLMLSRWPSLLLSTLTVPLIIAFGRRYLEPQTALFAAALFAISPEGMVWGGRARMYALATLFVFLTVFSAYKGVVSPKYRWFSLIFLALALLTQLGVLMLIPPLLIGMVIMGYIHEHKMIPRPPSALVKLLPYLITLALIIIMSLFIKRLGQPVGKIALNESEQSITTEIISTVTYQTTFYFTWADTEKFLARQFGLPHLYGLTLAMLAGMLVIGLLGLIHRRYAPPRFVVYLTLIIALLILEAVTLLEPFRRNSRYFVMYLPLFYLIAAYFIITPLQWLHRRVNHSLTHMLIFSPYLLLLTTISSLQIALITPEPAYETAFAYLHEQWQAGDVLLTMNSPAAGLYLNHVDGFTVEYEAEQFLLRNGDSQAVDRWLGAPWLGSATAFNAALNQHERAWFVSDTVRQPVYFGGSWQAIINSQMEQVIVEDNVLVYRTRPDRTPLPSEPQITINQQFGENIMLLGYTWQPPHLTLFWQANQAPNRDYTRFIHLRDSTNSTLYQQDGLPLEGSYPTSRWQPHETIIDPITLNLPPDLPADYRLYLGLYNLDTLERLPVQADTTGENAVILE